MYSHRLITIACLTHIHSTIFLRHTISVCVCVRERERGGGVEWLTSASKGEREGFPTPEEVKSSSDLHSAITKTSSVCSMPGDGGGWWSDGSAGKARISAVGSKSVHWRYRDEGGICEERRDEKRVHV